MTLKTIDELYQPSICPCGAMATVRGKCNACWIACGSETPSGAIADEDQAVRAIKETIMYGYSIERDDTRKPRRFDARQILREVRSWLGWLAVCFVAFALLYVFVGGLKGFAIGAAESARYLAGGGR